MDDLERAAREAEAVAYDRLPDALDEWSCDWEDGYERGAMAAALAALDGGARVHED